MTTDQVETMPRKVLRPRVDIAESDKQIELWLEMPGADEKSVDVSFEKNMLTIKGTVAESCCKEPASCCCEYETVDYERTFEIATEIDTAEISATIKDGLLHLEVPKKIEAPRNIVIEKRE